MLDTFRGWDAESGDTMLSRPENPLADLQTMGAVPLDA